jgi:hypothetical protein
MKKPYEPVEPLSLGNLLQQYQPKPKNKYVSREFQDYGYRLAMELGDEAHKSLYIRLAKTQERGLLEAARSFAIDSQARSKAKLFMWKLKELRAQKQAKKEPKAQGELSLFSGEETDASEQS